MCTVLLYVPCVLLNAVYMFLGILVHVVMTHGFYSVNGQSF